MKGLRSLLSGLAFSAMCLFALSGAAAESWGTNLFSIKRHDFGRVAIGADAEFRFEMQNGYVEDIRILGVSSSCGCTSVTTSTPLLRSTEKGAVIAKLNTSGQHTREKSATLTVLLETTIGDRTLQDTVQLFVTAYIRPDVVLTPGIVEFGSVAEGHAVVRTIRLEYVGQEDWALTKIERNNPYVHAKAEEIKRNGGEVAYRITVTLKDNAPVGYVRDALRFSTNEQRPGMAKAVEIRLPIQGVVMAPIHAKPSPFLVGLLAPGESVSKSIVVRSDTPFRIKSVQADDKRFRFTYADQESPIQLVSVLFSAKSTQTDKAIDLSSKIRIQTNLPDQEFVIIDALAHLSPPTKDDNDSEESATRNVPPADFSVAETQTAESYLPEPCAVEFQTRASTEDAEVSEEESYVKKSEGRKARFGTPRAVSSAMLSPKSSEPSSASRETF